MHTHLRGYLDEVDPHSLADERERPGRPEVALDHHAVSALRDELHVERARDVQPLRYGLRCVLQTIVPRQQQTRAEYVHNVTSTMLCPKDCL